MLELLEDPNVYERIDDDPTNGVNKKLKSTLTKLRKVGFIKPESINTLVVAKPVPPRIYGLPKTHKNGVPIRPIVSTIDSPGYLISKLLCEILHPITADSNMNIKNSFSLKEILDQVELKNDDVLLSLDVVSLFTNIPLKKARDIIVKKWEQFYSKDSLDHFLLLFDECTSKNNYFQYDGQFYIQKEGLAMGNPLSPILADIVMEDLFECKLKELKRPPTLIFKYVDDIIMAIPENMIEDTQDILHTYHPNIRFTIERENDKQIPYLEMLLIRKDNKIVTNWYCKTTSSNRILNYYSSHPSKMKYNVTLSFVKRVFQLSDSRYRETNKKRIFDILTKNNYPPKYIKKLITKALYTYCNRQRTIPNDTENTIKFGSITHIAGLTDAISKSLKNSNPNLFLAKKTNNTLTKSFSQLKDRLPIDTVVGLIYKIPCECGKVYIGETGKSLPTRVYQHKYDIRHTEDQIESGVIAENDLRGKTALVKHAFQEKHSFDFENAVVLNREKHVKKRRFKEACYIWENPENINYKTDTNKLHARYTHIFKQFSTIKSDRRE